MVDTAAIPTEETKRLLDMIFAAIGIAYAERDWAVALRLLRAAQLAVIGAAQKSGMASGEVMALRLVQGGKSLRR